MTRPGPQLLALIALILLALFTLPVLAGGSWLLIFERPSAYLVVLELYWWPLLLGGLAVAIVWLPCQCVLTNRQLDDAARQRAWWAGEKAGRDAVATHADQIAEREAAATSRVQAAETRAAQAERRAADAEQRASEAEQNAQAERAERARGAFAKRQHKHRRRSRQSPA